LREELRPKVPEVPVEEGFIKRGSDVLLRDLFDPKRGGGGGFN